MDKSLSIEEAIKVSEKIKQEGKTIVLVGGCFDILHIGHLRFLKEAKKRGDFLFVLLESDEKIKEIKGKNRPINTQEDRAIILGALNIVDYIILLPLLKTNQDYDDLISKVKPNIIATTKDDPTKFHKERVGKIVNAKVVDVIGKVSDASTTRLAKLIAKEF